MFPKSKRFTDKDSGVPPVGSYEVKNSASGVSHSFHKLRRFTSPSDSESICDVSISSTDSVQSATISLKTPKPVLIKGKCKPPQGKRPLSYSASSAPKNEKKTIPFVELENLKRLCADKDQKNAALQAQLQATSEDAKHSLSSATKEFMEMIAVLEEEKAELQKQVSQLSEDAVKHCLHTDGLQQQLKSYIGEISSTKQELRVTKELLEDSREETTSLGEESQRLQKELEATKAMITNLKEHLVTEKSNKNKMETDFKLELRISTEQVSNMQEKIKQAVSEANERAMAVRQELSRRLVDTQKRLSSQEAHFNKQKEDSSKVIIDMQRDIDRLKDENVKLAAEAASWKGQVDNLLTKYKPIYDQLEALDVLKSESSFAHAEFLRVSADYAKLLGHQNPKQKIHYVVKLKEENISLKQENTKLKIEIARQKKQKDHHPDLENSLAAANGKI